MGEPMGGVGGGQESGENALSCGIQRELYSTEEEEEEEELYTGSCIVQVCALDAVLTVTRRSVQRLLTPRPLTVAPCGSLRIVRPSAWSPR